MQKNNGLMKKSTFIICHMIGVVISMIFYRNILFKSIGNHSMDESKAILWLLLIAFLLIEIGLTYQSRRYGVGVILNLIIPYGTYTVWAYYQTAKDFIMIMIGLVITILFIYTLTIMRQKIYHKCYFKSVMFHRIVKVAVITQLAFAIGLSMIMLVLGINIFWDSISQQIVDPSVEPTVSEIVTPTVVDATESTTNEIIKQGTMEPTDAINFSEQTIANNIDTVLQLQEHIWQELSVQEKLDILQTVADIEQRYLGLPDRLTIVAEYTDESFMGYYSDYNHEIVINMNHLMSSSSAEMIDAVCHEAYHSYQYRLIDVYNGIDERSKKLKMFKGVTTYMEEFDNYISGEDDFEKYYNQLCESDAREYAENAVNDYFTRIDEHLNGLVYN